MVLPEWNIPVECLHTDLILQEQKEKKERMVPHRINQPTRFVTTEGGGGASTSCSECATPAAFTAFVAEDDELPLGERVGAHRRTPRRRCREAKPEK